MKRIKIGLALGGGAARGLAYIGVLQSLERSGIPIDLVAGCSMGSIIGALYAKGIRPDEMARIAGEIGSKGPGLFLSPTIPKSGLIGTTQIENALTPFIGDTRFEDLRIPFACVATDLHTGAEVIIRNGPLWEGIKASASIPVLFPVMELRGRHLTDGWLVNPVPVNVVREMGADLVIGVVVTQEPVPQKEPDQTLFGVIMNTIYIVNQQLVKFSLKGADVIVQPSVAHIGFFDFDHALECILEGMSAGERAIPEIKKRYQTLIKG